MFDQIKVFLTEHKLDMITMVTAGGSWTLNRYWESEAILALIAKGFTVIASFILVVMQLYKAVRYISDDIKKRRNE